MSELDAIELDPIGARNRELSAKHGARIPSPLDSVAGGEVWMSRAAPVPTHWIVEVWAGPLCGAEDGYMHEDAMRVDCVVCLRAAFDLNTFNRGAAQAYADAYRRWHGGDYSAASMKHFRATREAFLAAFPPEEASR